MSLFAVANLQIRQHLILLSPERPAPTTLRLTNSPFLQIPSPIGRQKLAQPARAGTRRRQNRKRRRRETTPQARVGGPARS